MISYRKSLDLLESIKDRASRDIMTRLKAPQQRFECERCREKEIHKYRKANGMILIE